MLLACADDLGTEDPFRGRLDDLPCYKGNGHLVDGLIPSSKVFVDSHSRHFMPNNGRAVAPDLVILEDGYGLDPFNVVACIEVQVCLMPLAAQNGLGSCAVRYRP